MPRAKKAEEHDQDGGLYMGRRISAREFKLHKTGAIVRTEADPETPPECDVEFRARAQMTKLDHEFLKSGTVKQVTTLAIDSDSFEILSVTMREPDPQLPGVGDEDEE